MPGSIAAGGIPAGVICMWSGTVATVPGGWALCNGANGTPNLCDRFIVGAGSAYAPKATGGANTHAHTATAASVAAVTTIGSTAAATAIGATTLTTAQMPSHTHTVSVRVAGSGGTGPSGNGSASTVTSSATGGGDSHTHTATGTAPILTASTQRRLVQTEDFSAPEYALFAAAGLFPVWMAGESYVTGDRLVHEGVVYEVQQPVTAQGHQPPGSAGMLAIYRPISADPDTGDTPDGSRDNPYSFISGMDVSTGKYYTFEGKLYLAKADMKPCVWNPGTAGLWQWELV